MDSVWLARGARGVDAAVEFGGGLVRVVMVEVEGASTVLRIRGDEARVQEAALAMRVTDDVGGMYCWVQSQGGHGVFAGVRDVAFAGAPSWGAEALHVSFGAARCVLPL